MPTSSRTADGSPRPGPVRAALDRLVASREIEPDGAQRRLADRLDQLDKDLSASTLAAKSSALGWLFGRAKAAEPVRGVYIHGDVGRGKTMIMDMFFRSATVNPKRRVHFHAFMAEVHERIGAHREAVKAGTAKGDDPMPPVGAAIAAEARLLCFDEFAVTDVADAMILSRLFKVLFAEGVVLVATSNVAPDDLYRNGLNRPLFLPFVEDLKCHADIMRLDAAADYRMATLGSDDLYVTPLAEDAGARMDAIWARLLDGQRDAPASLSVKGHTIAVPRAGNGAARFAFSDLMLKPVGAQDFLAIAKRFHTVVLDGVPVMGDAERNEAKRFITLVDTLYDVGRRIVLSAETPAEALYVGRQGAEAFEFARTISRLNEMRTEEYLAAHVATP
ncbi:MULTISPECIES: cell division protein ZapE [unclassified Aureimonas]|uniref:cell division protein ZapE n=1 Tax=unclassified Aureimonas TaxID=2615206 RepID=UPI0006F6A9DA|nr:MULTISPECIES: cell division protein ZapE [unclassified Aureimonas]KQT52615.1 ATPase [Aureimonas sp. Leaf427]KQT77486.1 ATPase [Aureimonas sp. Leaf460]